MELKFRPDSRCRYELLSMGEIMIRFDAGELRTRNARTFQVYEGGAEYNVARNLKKVFKVNTGVITAFADNEIGHLAEDLINQGGVDTSLIKWIKTDGIGRSCRNGLNFTERGNSIRNAVACPDRFNTAISKLKPEDIDFDYIFGELGVKWFHTGGIYTALSDDAAETVLKAVCTAKKYGTIVSYDINYRASLWELAGAKERIKKYTNEILKNVNVLFCTGQALEACGISLVHSTDAQTSWDKEKYKNMANEVMQMYPSIALVATTLRNVKSASVNDFSGIAVCNNYVYNPVCYYDLKLVDRIGSGDAFAAGLIYGLMTNQNDVNGALKYGIACGGMTMTTPGDVAMTSIEELDKILIQKDASINR